MYLSGYRYWLVRDQILHISPSGFMEFDHVTNRYLYPDRHIFLKYVYVIKSCKHCMFSVLLFCH
jgi:hypothetical protein